MQDKTCKTAINELIYNNIFNIRIKENDNIFNKNIKIFIFILYKFTRKLIV